MAAVKVQNLDKSSCDWMDALVAAPTSDDKWVVTSPNMDFIPTPPLGQIKVVLRADCRYGFVDPIQWPQVFSPGFEYLASVLRPVSEGHNFAPIWWTPCEHDFEVMEGSIIKCLGLLRRDAVQPLSDLVDALTKAVRTWSVEHHKTLSYLETAMRHARDRLWSFPCTWRDTCLQVRLVQRFWLMARAYIDFHAVYPPSEPPRSVNQQFMGAFTTDPEVVQNLYAAGIPVWWLRLDLSILHNTTVRSVVLLSTGTKICVDIISGCGEVLYQGLAGTKHLDRLSRGGHTYRDVSRTVLLAVDIDRGYVTPPSQNNYKRAAPTNVPAPGPSAQRRVVSKRREQQLKNSQPYNPSRQAHGTQVRGVNKFEPLRHTWMPAPLPAWERAMATVDLSKPSRPQTEIWGYWIPDPGLFVRPQSEDRRRRYLSTWLHMRPGWLYALRLREVRVTLVPTQAWRDFLYGDTGRVERNHETRNGQRLDFMERVFGTVFQHADFDLTSTGPVYWFSKRVSDFDENLCTKVLWEICELGFRHELLALDRLLVPGRNGIIDEEEREELLAAIFYDRSVFCVTRLPSEPAGLAGPTPFHRVQYLEAFRRVLVRWPRCPTALYTEPPIATNLSEDEVVEREEELLKFYVNSFFEQSGRAPIVPHMIPM